MPFEAPATPPVADIPADEAALAAAAVVTPDAEAAASSPVDAPDAKEPSLLDVIQDAIKPEAAASSAAEDSEVVPDADAEAVVADAEPVNDADLPFHTHPRWQQVIAENQTLRGPAEQYGKITSFMEEHGLAPAEVAEGYEVMALLKSGDPANLAKAREYFSTRLEALDGMLGNVLPEDLQERVDSGQIDDEGAQELARARATEKLREGQSAARTAADATAQAARDAEALGAAMVTSVNDWETRTKASDPDYARKAELVQTTCRAIVQQTGKPPATAEEAVALVTDAYKRVNAQVASLLPKPRPITPGPHGASTPTSTEPKTLREAVAGALAR
jgi:hypothetical protein